MDFERFITERVLKKDERQEITVICNLDTQERFVKRAIRDDKRYIYKTLQKILHKNIPKIIDVSLTDCTVVIEEYIHGITLRELMEQRYQFTYKQIESIANQLLSAMAELHKHNIIHRDIKPDNIIMNERGQIWLIDYDISRIFNFAASKDTTIHGTAGYAPVEQYGMMQTDYRTDIYAFGVTISQLLAYAQKKGSLYRIAQKCKRLDPAARYQNTKQLRRALRLRFVNAASVCVAALSAAVLIVIFVCISNLGGGTEKRYDEYIGTWRDGNGIILEMLSIEKDTAKFNIKAQQPNGSIRSINGVTGIINGGEVKFSTVITDFGDTADGVITFENNSIFVDVYTANMNTSASIRAATIVTKDE